MRKTCLYLLSLLLLTLPCPMFAGEEDSGCEGWALDVKFGTLGIGGDISRSIVPCVLNLRAGASFFQFENNDLVDNDIHYDADIKLGAIPISLDVFPFRNWFRLSGGVAINFTGIEGTAVPQELIGFDIVKIGDNNYATDAIGQLKTEVKVNRVSPYFGIGFSNPIKRFGRLGFFADLGLLYHGAPSVTLTTSTIPTFEEGILMLREDLAKQTQLMEDEAKDYKILPVVQLGLSYRF